MLAMNKDAGTVIGRGGATINKMQQATGSRIRVSNAHEYFPGTQDRVVLVTGPLESVSAGIRVSSRGVIGVHKLYVAAQCTFYVT